MEEEEEEEEEELFWLNCASDGLALLISKTRSEMAVSGKFFIGRHFWMILRMPS